MDMDDYPQQHYNIIENRRIKLIKITKNNEEIIIRKEQLTKANHKEISNCL